jgi:hypothetical protein
MHTLLDKVLVGPSPAELEAEALAALAAVHGEHRPRRPLTESSVRAGLRSVAELPEGRHQWLARPAFVSAAVGVAWWHDFGGRLHVRVVGARLSAADRPAGGLFGPVAFPPLALVCPERALVRPSAGEAEVLCLCACGAWGEARSLGWMGDRCGPCHDRGPDAPVSRAAGWRLGPGARAVAVGPDGTALAAVDGAGLVRTWGLADGAARHEAQAAAPDSPAYFALGPGGRTAATAHYGAGWSLDLWDVSAGRRLARLPIDFPSFAFLPDGSVLAPRDGAPVLLGPGRPDEVRPVPALRPGPFCLLAAGRDGRGLAAVSHRLETLAWCDGGVGDVVVLPGLALSPPAFSPEGVPSVVVRLPRREGPETFLLGCPGPRRDPVRRPLPWPSDIPIERLAFAPDGRLIAQGGSLVRVWGQDGKSWRVLLEGRTEGGERCDLLPDGRLLTFSRRDGCVKLWPAELFRR